MLRDSQPDPEVQRMISEVLHRRPEPPHDPRLMTDLIHALDQHVSLVCTDRAGAITWVNQAFCWRSGYAESELLGRNPRLLGSSHHSPEFFAELWQTIAGGGVWRGEIENRARDGSEYWVAATIAPLPTHAPLNSSYVALCVDITERKRETLAALERQSAALERQSAELECSRKELEQYAYVASHDLQEPLRAIVGCGQLLRQEYPGACADDTARQLLDHMIEGGQRMQQLVLALLQYSRVGTRAPRCMSVSSRAALDQAITLLGTSIAETGASIEGQDLPSVWSDSHQTVQLFQSLIENAIKYRSAERPIIRIAAQAQARYVQFSVADNGIGIDQQHFERVFTLFQRLHARGKYPGLGVGLSLCKKIVERHGGRIWVESQGSGGTTIHFTLPARPSSPGDEI